MHSLHNKSYYLIRLVLPTRTTECIFIGADTYLANTNTISITLHALY